MVRPGRDLLSGRLEVDETYVGGPAEGKRGRGADKKHIVVIAAEEVGKGIGRIRLRRVNDVSQASLLPWIQDVVQPGAVIHTDGWPAYGRLPKLGYIHEITVVNRREELASELLPRVHRGSVASQTVAAGHSSGCGRWQASRLLPRRIHVPVQSANLETSRQTVLSPGSTSHASRSGDVESSRNWK